MSFSRYMARFMGGSLNPAGAAAVLLVIAIQPWPSASAQSLSAQGGQAPIPLLIGTVDHAGPGAVVVRGASAARPRAADQIAVRDILRTDAASTLKVRLVDGSELTLGRASEAILDAFSYTPGRSSGSMFLDVPRGAARLKIGRLGRLTDRRIEVRFAGALITLSESEIWIGEHGGGPAVLLLSGHAVVRAPGGMAALREARTGTLLKDRTSAPTPPERWSRDTIANLLAKLAMK